MIISRTPLRISFAGGGSDFPAFYKYETGAVVSTAINQYIYITLNKKFDHKIRASYSVTEIVDSVGELKHDLIREGLKLVDLDGGIEITSISDIPSAGTGLGSSSTFAVGLLNALHTYLGQQSTALHLAEDACELEIKYCNKPIGKQDQYISACGGMQFIQFKPDDSVIVEPIMCNMTTKETLQRNLLLLYTGLTRSADNILTEQKQNIENNSSQRDVIKRMVELAQQLRTALCNDDLSYFGEILHENWLLKRVLANGISNSWLDDKYEIARKNGAMGGKLLGAGGGGFILFYAQPEQQQAIIHALPELRPVKFEFEPQGSKIIYIDRK